MVLDNTNGPQVTRSVPEAVRAGDFAVLPGEVGVGLAWSRAGQG